MTVSSTATRVTFTGNGVTVAFATGFPFFDASEIEVIERVIATGVETVKTLTTHYSVSGGGGASGTVTAVAAPASTVQWVIRRKTARTQEIDYTPNDPFPAETHEAGLDRLKMNVQELGEEQDRALKFPATDSASLSAELPSSVDRAGKFLTFDSSGEPTVSAGSADGLTVSSFAATLLDDADAAAARATLGISTTGLDIDGLSALTAPAVNDTLPIYDLSALANRKIALSDLFKIIDALTAETAPATGDEVAVYDVSAGTADKMTLSDLLKVLNSLTEDTSPDGAADFVLTYDTSASAVKKVKPNNLAVAGISGMSVQVFTGSGTWTKPSGVKFVRAVCVGPGGGGGGCQSGSSGLAGGGGAGGYSEKTVDVTAIASVAVTIGSGGGGGNGATGASGGAGSSATSFGAHCSAAAGSGGIGSASTPNGGAGGAGSSGDVNISGQAGLKGGGTYVEPGSGGNSPRGFGFGGRAVNTDTAGVAATGYGAGGGAARGGGGDYNGGGGASGICIVMEFK